MTRFQGARLLFAACVIATLQPALSHVSAASGAPDSTSGQVTLTGQTPTIVRNGRASLLHSHAGADMLAINLSLPFRAQAGLDTFIAQDAGRGIYLTQQQFDAQYAPTSGQVKAVEAWAAARRLHVAAVSGDNALITARGTAQDIGSALNLLINDYRGPDGRLFYSNDRDATVPAGLGVTAISGLNNLHLWQPLHSAASRALLSRALMRTGGYFPSDFRAAYDVANHGYDGTGQTIGFTLWGTSVSNSDLTAFASHTGDVAMSAGTGADQIEWIPANGGSSATDALVETALDVESAHGIATHAHLKYWLGDEVCSGGQCGGSDIGLEDAISAAANDSTIHVVSNSWGGGEATSTSDPFVSATAASFQHAVAVGTTFYFSSGDSGSNSGGTSLASYPADSPYVVAVGGTSLNTGSGGAYSSESAWSGSGGGCSTVFARPSWQAGVGAATCSGRAEPDVAADADPNTGAYVYVQGAAQQVGGTSLAAPLFMGMAAVADSYAVQNGLTRIGWAAPKIYSLANSSSYSTSFHDVTSGNNGYPSGTGWDEATGWGSIDWWAYVRAIVGTGGSATATTTPIPASTATSTPVSTPIGGNAITNGGFEAGSLSGWTTAVSQASGNAAVAPQVSSAQHHSGNYSTLVGGTSTTEPSGDSCIYQNFTTSGGTFSAWYLPYDPSGDTITYDWQEAYLRPTGTTGCGESGTQLFKVEANSQAWTQVSTTLASGSYQIYFNVHEDGYGDPSYMYVDDVSAPAAGATVTATPVPPTSTPTPSPIPSATRTPAPTSTATPVPATSTSTPVPASTLTSTPVPPTSTRTPVPASTATATNTAVPSGTSTSTVTSTPVPATSTNTPVPTSTATATLVPPTATGTPVVGGGCASNGTCLTGLTASATSVPVNTASTLTATTNTDVGPTPWYIDIVDRYGTIYRSCASGSSCAVGLTARSALSDTFTAYLSTSSSSIAGGGPHSNSVTVSWH